MKTATYFKDEQNIENWHDAFWSTNPSGVTAQNYYTQIKTFLDGGSGSSFKGFIKFVDDNNATKGIKGAYMSTFYKEEAVKNSESQVDTMDKIREDVENILPRNEMFPFTFGMVFIEQFKIIEKELWRVKHFSKFFPF